MSALPEGRRPATKGTLGEGSGVTKHTADLRSQGPALLGGTGVIQFGIFCCAVTMVIVLAVALSAAQ